jgi:muramoyltetrapeptide carboxypeptidase
MGRMVIGVVAPASRLDPSIAERVAAVAAGEFPEAEVRFDPQCFLQSGHFAGADAARAEAFLRLANDPAVDAVWIGRGGYGSARLIASVLPGLTAAAKAKTYLGYSDAGALLGAMYGEGCHGVAHGPVAADILRPEGERAVRRALAWLVRRDPAALEPGLGARPAAAFNMTILASLLGTPWLPDLEGHDLLLEEVSEHMYRIDRTLLHLFSTPAIRRVAGVRLGRCSLIPPNDPDFGADEGTVCRSQCDRAGITYLGRAEIGHDVENRIVPFGVR